MITGRAALQSNVRFPRFDDKVDRLCGVGKESARKLRRIGKIMTTEEMVQKHGNIKLPPPKLLCVTQGTAVTKPLTTRHIPAAHSLVMLKIKVVFTVYVDPQRCTPRGVT